MWSLINGAEVVTTMDDEATAVEVPGPLVPETVEP